MQTLLDWYRAGVDVQPLMPLLSTYLGHAQPSDSYWYLTAAPELLELAADRLHAPKEAGHECARADAASVVHRPADRSSATPARTRSPPTATRSGCCSTTPSSRLGRQPCQLDIAELDAPLIAAFLDHLETERGNSIRTRNLRLAAIHSLFRYAQHRHPEHAQDIARVLAIPLKRADRAIVTFLDEHEIEALLDAPDRSTWTGRRDHALLVLAIQTGLRASELTGLQRGDVHLDHRATRPLPRERTEEPDHAADPDHHRSPRVWLAERAGHPDDPLFPTARGGCLTRDALDHRLTQIHRHRRPTLPDPAREASHAAHAPTHRGDAAAARRRRHHRDRALARPRTGRHHPDLPPRRPRAQRTRDRSERPHPTPPGRYKPPDTLLAFLDAL